MSTLRGIFVWVTLVWLTGCAHSSKTFADYPATAPVLSAQADEGPAVDALLTSFYERAFEPEQLRQELEAALDRHPRSSRAHEVAAQLALLEGDTGKAVDHWLAAASDLTSPLTDLYLWELGQLRQTVSEQNRVEALLRALIAEHQSPQVRSLARAELANLLRRRLQLAPARELVRELGYLESFNLIGPFDNDQGKGFLSSYPPEQEFKPAAEYPGKVLPVRWHHVTAADTGAVPLDDLISPNDFAVAYLVTYVHSDVEGVATLRLTTGDAAQVWWNDALAASEEKIQYGAFDNLALEVHVNRGWNKLLIKSCVRGGYWTLAARLTKADGSAWPGLQSSVSPEAYVPAPAGAKRAASEFLPAAVTKLPRSGRRELLSSRYALVAGRYKEVLPPLERWLQMAPENALVRYHAALAHWQNDELGKVIDLLGAAAERYPELRAFFLKRARYYKHKKLWEKAVEDLRKAGVGGAAGGEPQAREVNLELADVYEQRGFSIDRCRALQAVVTSWPDLVQGHLELSDCLDGRGYDDRAEAELQLALALEPGNQTALQRLGDMAARRRDFETALELTGRLRALSPHSLSWLTRVANLERRRGQREASRAALSAAQRQSANWSVPYERLADLAYEEGKEAEALELYRQALARNPRNSALGEKVAFLEPEQRGFLDNLVPSEAQIEAAIDGASKLEVLPGSYCVVLVDHEVTEIASDGSAKRIITYVSRAETEQCADRMTKMDLPGSGTVKVLKAYALTAQGERQEASSVQSHVVRYRQLDPGSITVIQYVHYQPPGAFLPNHYATHWFFQNTKNQIEDAKWIVVHAKGRELKVAIRGDVQEQRAEEGERVVRTFSARHVPPLVDEPNMPPANDLLRQVAITTLGTWDEYVRWERALLSDAFRSSPEIEALAARLTKDAATPRAKLDQLYHYVSKDIRYQQEYETTIAGVRPHTGPVTLERGYGDCKDKAVLLIRMAKLVGLNLHFALLRTTDAGQVQKDIPNQQFNHAIVYVPESAGLGPGFFLDPTTDALDMGNLRSDDQGALSLVVDPDGTGYSFIQIPYQDAALTHDKHQITVRIESPTQATAVDKLNMRGNNAASVRRLLRNREVADKALQSLASALFTGSTLSKNTAQNPDDLWRPLELELTLDISQSIQAQGESWRLPIPAHFPDYRASTLVTRRTPVHFGPPHLVSYQVDVEVPEGFAVTKAPPALEVEHACFHARRTMAVKGRTVAVQFDFTRRCTRIEVQDYPAYRQAALDVIKALRDEVVFARANAALSGRRTTSAAPAASGAASAAAVR